MTHVPRHAIDPKHARRQIETLSTQISSWLSRVPESLKYLRETARMLACYRFVVDPTAAEPETRNDLRLAAQAAAALFAGPPGETVEFTIGEPLRFTAPGPTTSTNAGAWRTATWLSVAAQDDELTAWLCDVPLDTLRAAGVEHDAYLYPWVESIRAFLRREPVPPDMFIPAMDGTDPDQARHTPPDAMLQVVYPPILMFYYVLRRDPDKFNAALEQALVSHRKWWTAADRADDADGFVALEPLGVTILAQRVGMPVTVTSEYLLTSPSPGP